MVGTVVRHPVFTETLHDNEHGVRIGADLPGGFESIGRGLFDAIQIPWSILAVSVRSVRRLS